MNDTKAQKKGEKGDQPKIHLKITITNRNAQAIEKGNYLHKKIKININNSHW